MPFFTYIPFSFNKIKKKEIFSGVIFSAHVRFPHLRSQSARKSVKTACLPRLSRTCVKTVRCIPHLRFAIYLLTQPTQMRQNRMTSAALITHMRQNHTISQFSLQRKCGSASLKLGKLEKRNGRDEMLLGS